MCKRRLFLTIICVAAVLLSICIWNSIAEKPVYTIIVSDSVENAAGNLQDSISDMIGEEVHHKKIDYRSPEAKAWIKRLGIKFVPYVIFGKAIQRYDKFSDMVKNKMVILRDQEYVIPDKMLVPLGIMFFERPLKSRQLDVFIMSQCPLGNDALHQFDSYLTSNPGAVNVTIHYILDFNEAGMNSIRGPAEITEDIRQILIQKYYPDKFWQYHQRRYLHGKNFKSICADIGISSNKIEAHKEEGVALLKKDFDLCAELNISYSINSSPTFLWENQILLSSMKQVYEFVMSSDVLKAADMKTEDNALPVIVFYGPRCPHCRRLIDKQAPQLKKEFGDKISFIYYNSQVPENAEKKRELEDEYEVLDPGNIPEVFVAGRALVGGNAIRRELKGIIKKYMNEKDNSPEVVRLVASPTNAEPYSEKISRRFQSFTPIAIIGSGLLDGINPCAFSTIVFFMSFLVFAQFSFYRMMLVGIFFILGVFLSYLGLGLGAFLWLEKIRAFVVFSRYFDITVGVIAILLGAASLYDYFIYKRKGTSKGILLQLPKVVKNAIYSSIGKLRDKGKSGMLKLLFFSFGLGVLVSLLESLCTGQVYVPTLSFMIKMKMMGIRAFSYLLLYNFMFVLPLIIVFLSTLFGVNSKWWAKFVQLHVGRIKLMTALFFFTIGILLIVLV